MSRRKWTFFSLYYVVLQLTSYTFPHIHTWTYHLGFFSIFILRKVHINTTRNTFSYILYCVYSPIDLTQQAEWRKWLYIINSRIWTTVNLKVRQLLSKKPSYYICTQPTHYTKNKYVCVSLKNHNKGTQKLLVICNTILKSNVYFS